MYDVFIGLGANIGDRFASLQRAVSEIEKIVEVVQTSSVYETEPVGMNSVHQFFNIALKIRTDFEPQQLLHKLKYIEKKLGRSPSTHLKDREIDIDILLYDDLYLEDPEVHVPHPALAQRLFVLTPLQEIAPMVKHPVTGTTVKNMLSHCPDKSTIQKTEQHLTLLHQHH